MSFDWEIAAARSHMAGGKLNAAMAHLERAHVIGQQQVWPHVLTHWLMLRVELQRGRAAAAFGQLLRIVLGALGSALGLVPTGNTGGSDIGMFKRMPIPDELQAASEAQPRNPLADAAFMAWFAVLMMALAMAWPESRHLAAPERYSLGIGWPVMFSTLLLAVLLSAPRLVPRYRVMASKLLSIGLLAYCCFSLASAPALLLVLVTGRIFLGAKKK
ncbi:DUF3703 domain-containing protein [Pseudoduganella sp. HUAS MS19]